MALQKINNMSLIVDTKHALDTWCVYEHQVTLKEGEPPTTILVGACRLHQVFHMMDGKTNTDWLELFRNGGSVLLRIVALTNDKVEAHRHAGDLVRATEPTPRCNLHGYNTRGVAKAIRCINNDRRYNTQKEAADDLGIAASSISRHLRGDLTSVQGFRFVYDAPASGTAA